MYASNVLESYILNAFREVPWSATSASGLYVELSLTPPNEAGEGVTPPAYTGYARQQVTFGAPVEMQNSWGLANTLAVTFPQTLTDAGTVTHIAIYSALTGGEMLLYGPLNTPKPIVSGATPIFQIGEIKYWLSGDFADDFKKAILQFLSDYNSSGVRMFAVEAATLALCRGLETTLATALLSFTEVTQTSSGQSVISNASEISMVAASNLAGYDMLKISGMYGQVASMRTIAQKGITPGQFSAGDEVNIPVGSLTVTVN